MNTLEKRIMQVSEMIATNMCEGAIGFRSPDLHRSKALEQAEVILDPSLKALEKTMYLVLRKHDLHDEMFNSLRFKHSDLSYTIGILAGLHLAGRSDLIPKLATAYSKMPVSSSEGETYDDNGGYAPG